METRQAWITGVGQVDLIHGDLRQPHDDEVVVETANVGICGSDLHTWRQGHSWLPFPIPPGHEASGWVAAVGAGVKNLTIGDPVVLSPIVSCGVCFMCRRGKSNLCARLRAIGAHDSGAMSDYFLAPTSSVIPLPGNVSMVAGALIEPLACVVHASRLVGGVASRSVVIIGAGSIGLLSLLNATAQGAEGVVVTDKIAAKRDIALTLGASAAVDAASASMRTETLDHLGGRPDVVLDCVGSPDSIRFAAELAEPGGQVVVVGVSHGETTLPVSLLQDREVMVVGSAMYVDDDFRQAIDLVTEGLPLERLVTRQFPLTDVAQAFQTASTGSEVKVHLRVREEPDRRA